MTCARRLAGARKPAPSAGSPSRPDARPGRRRARFSLFLPALALLLCGLHLLAAAPAAAQTVTAPSVPRNVQVTPGNNKLTITWQAPSSWGTWPAVAFLIDVKRSSSPDSAWDVAKHANSDIVPTPTATSAIVSGTQINFLSQQYSISNGTAYDLRIRAASQQSSTDGSDPSHFRYSSWVTVSNQTPAQQTLATPSVTRTPGDSKITVSWDAVDNADEYAVQYGVSGSGNAQTATTSDTHYVISSLTNGTSYAIRVQARDSTAEYLNSAWSSWAGATPQAPVAPGVPEDVTVIRGDGQLGLLWQPPASWGTWPAGGFQVEGKLRSADNTKWARVRVGQTLSYASFSPTDIMFVFTGSQRDADSTLYTVTNGTAYDLRIRARTQEPDTDGSDESHYQHSSWITMYGRTPSKHTHGDPPGRPTLTWVQTGTNAPTASTLSFTIPCVSPGKSHVTNYVLLVAQNFSPYGNLPAQHFTVPSPCRTITVTLTGLTASRQYIVQAFARNLVGRRSERSDSASGTTASGQGTIRPPGVITRDLAAYEELIGKVRDWRNDSRYVNDKRHTDRWDRVLLAFRQPVSDASLTAMSAAEAQRYADRGWTRWVEVAAALRELESAHPVVTIAGGGPVTEGTAAGFTLTASRAPSAGLAVTVSVAQSGAFAQASALGTRTVTIPSGSTTAAFTVATVDDGADEADGGIVASVASGSGYTVGDAARATVAVADNDEGNPDIVTKRTIAREGTDEAAVFTVRLSRAASHAVTVDYATADATRYWAGSSPARSGADYTATSGTLTFAAGETSKTVSVPILDDAIDEGMEYFLLRFSNPQGAGLAAAHRERQGVIRNSDPLQAMWLARFGRMVASDAVGAVTARLETPRNAGSHLTVAGQRLNLSGDGTAFAHHGLAGRWNDPATATTARSMSGRELLTGTSFRAVLGSGAGPRFTSWGQGASVSRFSASVPGLGLSGESATGSMGMDYERGRWLAGLAMTHSLGEGAARDAGWRYALGSTATMMLPYARYRVSERVSAWGLAGTGKGRLTLDLDGGVPQHYGTDLSMTLAAAGVRGDLVTPAEAGGFALALKADAFWVRTESDRVMASEFGGLSGARGESSRVRAVLDGSRTFALAGGAALTPSVELGVRHDGGDAETGTGLEFGAGVGYADPSWGLDMALRVHGLAVHAEEGYGEWGVSGQLRLVPGVSGRGLSMSLTPSYGVDPGGSEQLWALPESSGLAVSGDADPSTRLDAEVGYGMAMFGGRFTGTPNVGFGVSDGGGRDWRMGWRLTSAVRGRHGLELNLDATRRESSNDNGAEHGVMLRAAIHW